MSHAAEDQTDAAGPGMIARSASMLRVLDIADKVARADISVLISGESGTGKEVMARYLHEQSDRRSGPFVALNCAAIPEQMLEAVLFGHEKGAYTGAVERRIGKFELAHRGTLLLDEITEMPVALQAKLLRVLQEREVERLGSHVTRKVDVRVLATSNRDLKAAVAQGSLREDLFYRLSVFPLRLPPLRERREDILPLAAELLSKHGGDNRWRLDPGAEQRLLNHSWPGNVRELENCMQRVVVLCECGQVRSEDLTLELASIEPIPESAGLQENMRNQEDRMLLAALDQHAGSRKDTARELGISERTLRYKLKSLRDRGITV